MKMSGMTTKEAAAALGLSASRVIQLAQQGRIRHERTPLGRLYDPADVERLRRERAAAETAA